MKSKKLNEGELEKELPNFNDFNVLMKLIAEQKAKNKKTGLRKLPPKINKTGGKGTFAFPGPRIGSGKIREEGTVKGALAVAKVITDAIKEGKLKIDVNPW